MFKGLITIRRDPSKKELEELRRRIRKNIEQTFEWSKQGELDRAKRDVAEIQAEFKSQAIELDTVYNILKNIKLNLG